jgi:tripartite-type tricarboxylate transporter receptor subunit TctC
VKPTVNGQPDRPAQQVAGCDRRALIHAGLAGVLDRSGLSGLAGGAGLLGLGGLSTAHAASTAPLRIVVGAPSGGSTDTLARAIATQWGRLLNRTVLVDNRPGAGGNIAADAVAKSAPDGDTVLMSFTSHAINPSLYPSLPFDPINDFTPLTCVATSPSILVAHPALPVRDLAGLIALAKARPGRLNLAIGAVGSSVHLAGEAFKMQTGTFIVNIPYRGTSPALQDVLAGQVELMFAAVGNVQAHIKAGKLRALGVTSAKRLAAYPDVPAIAELLPGYESSAWFGLFGPGKMSKELSLALSDTARQAIATPEVRRRIESEGAVPVGNTPEEFGRFVQTEIIRWGRVVKFSGAKPE